MNEPKLLTRDELLADADKAEMLVMADVGPTAGIAALRLAAMLCRQVAALLPADGAEDAPLPPIDKDDERIVDALVAKAQEGRASRPLTPRQVTQTIEDLRGAVRSQLQRERDAAIARAEAAEKRVAELERDMLEIAHATGVVYEAEGHAPKPGPTAAIVQHIEEDQERLRNNDDSFWSSGHAAGIREGLTRAAVACQDIGANPTAHADTAAWCYQRIVKLKEQVK